MVGPKRLQALRERDLRQFGPLPKELRPAGCVRIRIHASKAGQKKIEQKGIIS